jgi:DNA invertase Pin-like site-specific DNA recombinase
MFLHLNKKCKLLELWDKEGLVFTGENKDPFQSLMLNLLSSIAHSERDLLLERQRKAFRLPRRKASTVVNRADSARPM